MNAGRSRSLPKRLAIKCPVCSGAGRVYDCRAAPNGFRRSYECPDGHGWVTLEVMAVKFRGRFVQKLNEDK